MAKKRRHVRREADGVKKLAKSPRNMQHLADIRDGRRNRAWKQENGRAVASKSAARRNQQDTRGGAR